MAKATYETSATILPPPPMYNFNNFKFFQKWNARKSSKRKSGRKSALEPQDVARVEKLISTLVDVHKGLKSHYPDLAPSQEKNEIFSRLVNTCLEQGPMNVVDAVLEDERIKQIQGDLRTYSAEGEGMLEKHWAKEMLSMLERGEHALRPIKVLESFTYYNNYIELTAMEINVINSVSPSRNSPRSFCFIGSGPMPLTSICLAQILDPVPSMPTKYEDAKNFGSTIPSTIRVHNIDCDKEAIELSSKLCKAMGRPLQSLSFEAADISSSTPTDYTSFDVVYLAALVGISQEEKTARIRDVVERMREGSLLVMRSAHSLRKLLYPVVEPTALYDVVRGNPDAKFTLEPLIQVHPWNKVVNSIVVARVERRKVRN